MTDSEHIVLANCTVRHRWQGTPAGIQIIRDLEFKRAGEKPLRMDIWMPEAPAAPVPVILWICGGGWRGMHRRGVATVAAWLCAHGFALAGVDYRVSGEARFPACIEDLKAAVRWLRAHAGVHTLDPDRIGVWGDSAGGHLAELLGVTAGVKELQREGPHLDQSSAVAAVCAFYPPADLRTMAQTDFVQELIGWPLQDNFRAVWDLASPITHVRPGLPPHLLVHGTADEIVPFEQSTRYAAALRQAGVPCTLVELTGVKHDGAAVYGAEEVKTLVAAFFKRHLGKPRG